MTAVLLTRPTGRHDPLASELSSRGVRVHAVPAIRTVALVPPALDLRSFDWVVVTSAAGVRALAPALDLREVRRWAAVGPATARALVEVGVEAVAMPERARGVEIAGALGDVAGRRLLLARGELAADDLPDRLRADGAEVVELVAYRTEIGPEESRAPLAAALDDRDLAAAVYASGSALRGVRDLAGVRADEARAVPAVTIGPSTSAAARELGFTVAAEAASPGTSPLLAALLEVIGWQR